MEDTIETLTSAQLRPGWLQIRQRRSGSGKGDRDDAGMSYLLKLEKSTSGLS